MYFEDDEMDTQADKGNMYIGDIFYTERIINYLNFGILEYDMISPSIISIKMEIIIWKYLYTLNLYSDIYNTLM